MSKQCDHPGCSHHVTHPCEVCGRTAGRDLDLSRLGQVQANFRWRNKRGEMVRPEDMSTQHLFMTLVAIWNGTCAIGLEIERSGRWHHNLYAFGPAYDEHYLHTAIVCPASELSKRDDLEDCWWDTLELILERASRKKVT